jgi:hypothetical protein
MSRKSKGTFTCKIVAQNERGMLGQVRDSVYRGVKYCGEDGQVEKTFCFPRKLAEEKWLEWLDADLTEDELRILEPLNRKQRRVAKRTNEHNAKLKAELEEERKAEGRPKNMDAQADKQHGKQLKCYAIMATAQGGVRPAMVLTDERDAYDMCAALEAAGAVLTEKVSYEVVETILRH